MRKVVVFVVLVSSVQAAFAQSPRSIEGAWGVALQQRDCTTQAPIGPPLRALVTYHEGGTLTESSGALAFLPGQRSVSHGTWNRQGLAHSDQTVTMLLFDTAAGTPPGSPGFQAGWQIARHDITLSGPDNLTATGTSEFYNLAGQVYRTTCATRTGERLK